jgi:hypothetical protein
MVEELTYKQAIPAESTISVKTGADTYDVYYPKILNDGTCVQLCRELAVRQFDFGTSPPTIGAESTIDVETPSTYTNPVIPTEFNLGYDFDSDKILMVLGEWDTSSLTFENITDASLLSIDLAFVGVTVENADLLALAQGAIPTATELNYVGHFYGYGTKIVGALGTYAGSSEKSCIATYDGAAWGATQANTRFNYIQEGVEPIWDASNTFLGWLTEGHGTNSHFVKYSDLSVVTCYPPGVYTTCPHYDMKNHKVIWLEYGSGTGAGQYIHTSDPDATFGCINFVNVTPYVGTITDNESNVIDLETANKAAGVFFSDGVNEWMVLGLSRGGIPAGQNRPAKVNLGQYNDYTKWSILENNLSVDTGYKDMGRDRCIDTTNHVFLPNPRFQVLAANPWV